jgi:hypothetical protein
MESNAMTNTGHGLGDQTITDIPGGCVNTLEEIADLIEKFKAGTHAFRVEVQTHSCGPNDWASNAMFYLSPQAALEAGSDLFNRWTAVKHWRVVAFTEAK